MLKYRRVLLPGMLLCALGTAPFSCGEDEKTSEERDSEEAMNIQQNCSFGCVGADACNSVGGAVDYTFTCPNTATVCCDIQTDNNDSEDNTNDTPITCRYSCVEYAACEMSAMRLDMSCAVGVCCDNPNAQDESDTGEPCMYSCVPYAACEFNQMHAEAGCSAAGQICCDTTYVWVDTETGTGTDTETDTPSDTDTTDTNMPDTETDTGPPDTEVSDSESDSATADTDSADTETPECAFWCVAADDCTVAGYHPEMNCDGAGIVCCDL